MVSTLVLDALEYRQNSHLEMLLQKKKKKIN